MSYLSPNCQALGPQSPTQLQGNGADTKITITVLLVPQTFPMCSGDVDVTRLNTLITLSILIRIENPFKLKLIVIP